MRHNLIPLSDLNLTDRFLFDEVMEDSQAHQDALSIIFGHPVPLLGKNETEKELRVSPAIRSVRMDVFPWMRRRVSTIQRCRRRNNPIWRSAADTISP